MWKSWIRAMWQQHINRCKSTITDQSAATGVTSTILVISSMSRRKQIDRFWRLLQFFVIEIDPTGNNRCKLPCKKWAIPHLFERLFLISWENNRDCHLTMSLSLKTMEVQIKGDHWNKRFRTMQVYCKKLPNAFTFKSVTDFFYTIR